MSPARLAGYDNRAVLDVLVLAATKLISNYTNRPAQMPPDAFMEGSESSAPGKLKPAARLATVTALVILRRLPPLHYSWPPTRAATLPAKIWSSMAD